MENRFVAIDVETANASYASICQIGTVVFEDGQIVDRWETLVNPEDRFDRWNVGKHGIDEETVRDAPTLPNLAQFLKQQLHDQLLVCHGHFDRVSLSQAFAKYSLEPFESRWLDSGRVARRCWEQFAWSGYRLPNVCRFLGIEYTPHNAGEDARAAGLVLLRAMAETGLDIASWVSRVEQSVSSLGGSPVIAQEGNPQGDLYGEEIVFTGRLMIVKMDAAALAARIGCSVREKVSKTTTIVVVGDQDIKRLGRHTKSANHRKAEAAIEAGRPLRILKESDFLQLISVCEDAPRLIIRAANIQDDRVRGQRYT